MFGPPNLRVACDRLSCLPSRLPLTLPLGGVVLAACAAALILVLLASISQANAESAMPLAAGQVVISEFMAEPFDDPASSSLRDEDGSICDWIELHNTGSVAIDLSGWALSDKPDDPQHWQFPSGTSIPADGYLVVFASGKNRATHGKALHTNFALDRDGEYLALVDPSRQISYSFAPKYRYQYTGVSYGLAGTGVAVNQFLIPATPGMPNGAHGPVITSVTHEPIQPSAGQNLLVRTRIIAGPYAVSASLHYRFGFGAEQTIAMSAGGDNTYSAQIPADTQQAGALVRYYVTALAQPDLANGATESRWPLSCWRNTFHHSASPAPLTAYSVWLPSITAPKVTSGRDYVQCPEYLGTVVGAAEIESQSQLPTLHWYVEEDPVYGWEWYRAAYDEHIRAGLPAWAFPDSPNRAAVYYAGRLYDNVTVRLAGSGSKAYSKKSLNFEFNDDDRLYLRGTEIPGVKFDPSTSLTKMHAPSTGWDESYVRQALAWRAYMLSQVPSPLGFSIRLQLNGKFFSVTTFVEPIHTPFFQRTGLEPDGTLFKSLGNSLFRAPSGLPFDSASGTTQQRPDTVDRTLVLGNFINGINPATHGSPDDRTKAVAYAYDYVNVPEVINYMATRTVLDDFDTLWHNYLVHQDLRVDLDHPDDLSWSGTREWSLIPWDKDYIFLRLNGIYPAGAEHPYFGVVGLSEKANGLFDLILQDTNLRAMYLRRLRTVMDLILSSDASRSWIDLYAQQLLDRVAPDAVLDSKRYAGSSVPATDIKIAPFDPNQLRNRIEQRRRELYDTAPGHFGSLIPSVQHDPVIQFAAPEKADTVEQSATVLMNCGSEAVDISNWSLQGGEGRTYQVRPGVVIPGNGGRLYVTPNVSAFRAYQRQQRNVEILGLFVQGGFDARLLGVLQVGNFVPATLILRNGATIVATNQAPLLTCP